MTYISYLYKQLAIAPITMLEPVSYKLNYKKPSWFVKLAEFVSGAPSAIQGHQPKTDFYTSSPLAAVSGLDKKVKNESLPTALEILDEAKKLHKETERPFPSCVDFQAMIKEQKDKTNDLSELKIEALQKILKQKGNNLGEILLTCFNEEKEKLTKLLQNKEQTSESIINQQEIVNFLGSINDNYKKEFNGSFNIPGELSIDRATFNLTGNPTCLDKYLPIKQYLQVRHPEKLKDYKKIVNLLCSKTRICNKRAIHSGDNGISVNDQLKDGTETTDKSTRYFFAALVAELFHNKSDWVNLVLNRKNQFTVVFTDKILNSNLEALYQPKGNAMVFERKKFWGPIMYPDSFMESKVTHEFAHAVEARKGKGGDELGEMFPGLTKEQKERFLQARSKLIKQFKEKSIAFDHHAFEKDDGKYKEFSACVTQQFHHRHKKLLEENPSLYHLYVEIFGIDPMETGKDRL